MSLVLLHNLSGHVLTAEGLFTAQHAADAAAASGVAQDVDVGTMRAGVVRCHVSPAGVLREGTAANKSCEQSGAQSSTARGTISAHSIKETQMAIIRDRAKLVDAGAEDLLDTYKAMTGDDDPQQFSTEVLRVKTDMAVLSNLHAAGHLGVSRGGQPDVMTYDELEARRKERRATEAGFDAHGLGGRRQRPGTERQSAMESNIMATKKAAATTAAGAGGRPKQPVTVSATGNGTTNVRPTSFRGQVLAAITAKKKISTTDLDAQFGKPTLGEVRVLEKLGHVAVVA